MLTPDSAIFAGSRGFNLASGLFLPARERVRDVIALYREVREMGSVAIGMTANRRVLGALNDLASLARFEIEDNPSIDFVTLAVKLAETPCSPLKYESPRTVSLALLRHATS